ncbi:MAG: FtsQ-type POTRA domain-containing protein [bacterium]|nr:FtsQ-type POTRA domain-containing protein [bacterium]
MKTMTAVRTGLKGETDFFRRQNNTIIRKQKKLRSIKIKGIHLLFILTLLSFVAFAIFKTARFVLTWEKLNIKSFTVSGCPQSKLPEVKKILKRYRGNILTLNPDRLRADLVNIPEVKDVSISRTLPGTVGIGFMLREPVFQLESKGKYNIMDKEGVMLYRQVGKRDDLITVRNVARIRKDEIIPYLSQLETIRKYIQYVSLRDPYGILLKLKGIPETFYPGDIDFAGKIDYYLKLRKRLSLNKQTIRNVDLRFRDRFYLEYHQDQIQQEVTH